MRGAAVCYRWELENLVGPKAVEDTTNPAQMNRIDWYAATNFTKPYPGDGKILGPDQVPGRYNPAYVLGE